MSRLGLPVELTRRGDRRKLEEHLARVFEGHRDETFAVPEPVPRRNRMPPTGESPRLPLPHLPQAERLAPAVDDELLEPVERRVGKRGIALEEIEGVAAGLCHDFLVLP